MSNRKMWTTRDGTKVRIRDMTDSHLLNTIRMLDRFASAQRQVALIEAYAFADTVQGEQAGYDIENMIETLEEGDGEDFRPPIYEDLVDEAYRRKLTLLGAA